MASIAEIGIERKPNAHTDARALLSGPEAARYLGMSHRFVQKETAAGNIPVVRIGSPGSRRKATRYRPTDLDAYIERNLVGGAK